MTTRRTRQLDDETIIAKYNEHKQKAEHLMKYFILIGIIAGVCLLMCKHMFQDHPEFATVYVIFALYTIGIILLTTAIWISLQIGKYFFWAYKRIQIKQRRR